MTPDGLGPDAIRARLDRWTLEPPITIAPLSGGINSQVWLVETGRGRFVAKAAHPGQLGPGLAVAERLEAAGFAAGAPLHTAAGERAIALADGRALALLRFVSGRPLDRALAADRARIGETLGRVHAMLLGVEPPAGLPRWPWSWLRDREGLSLPPRVAAAIDAAARDAETIAERRGSIQGILHGDAAGPDFRFDETTGAVGLVDWGAAMFGPLLYDLASFCALGRVAGSDRGGFLAAYARRGPPAAVDRAALDAFVRLRWAVQAHYFGGRLARGLRTGMTDDRENAAGYADALDGLGLS